ncbi:MAG: sulfur carrier protein ThiS [Rhodoferax sp.]|jgi:thiamine biosynthesis protein ThiS|nr:sulfur carrier protein ThiS [Rhodoferax sp.]
MTPLALHVNGADCETTANSLQDLLLELGYALNTAMACAINNHLVHRADWPQRALAQGDRVDVIVPITGG